MRERLQTIEQLLDPFLHAPKDAQLEDVAHRAKEFGLLSAHVQVSNWKLELAESYCVPQLLKVGEHLSDKHCEQCAAFKSVHELMRIGWQVLQAATVHGVSESGRRKCKQPCRQVVLTSWRVRLSCLGVRPHMHERESTVSGRLFLELLLLT